MGAIWRFHSRGEEGCLLTNILEKTILPVFRMDVIGSSETFVSLQYLTKDYNWDSIFWLQKCSNSIYIMYRSTYVEGSHLVLGDLSEEEEVLQWLITQRTEDRIELITRIMLEGLVEETQYLAVYFCKYITEKDIV